VTPSEADHPGWEENTGCFDDQLRAAVLVISLINCMKTNNTLPFDSVLCPYIRDAMYESKLLLRRIPLHEDK